MKKEYTPCHCFDDFNADDVMKMKVPKRLRGPRARRQPFLRWHLARVHVVR